MKTIKDLKKAIDSMPDSMPVLLGNFYDDCLVIEKKTVRINGKEVTGLHISDELDD